MNIDTAKTISIIDLLRTLDHAPVSIRGDRYNFLSPIRTEKEPSFCVSKKRNEWYDFGLGQGGDIINLSKRLFDTNDVSEVLSRLDKLNISHVEHSCKTIKAAAVHTTVKMENVHLQPLQYNPLMSYLRSRHIDAEVGMKYCKEVWYTHGKKRYFGIAFENIQKGMEIRNPYYKGCMGHKDISIVHAETIGVQEAVCIFEGFMDFLSFKTLEKQGDGRAVVDEPCDYIVLNSVANMQRCLQRLGVYEHIYCFLDNDKAGMDGYGIVRNAYPTKAIDMSFRYKEYKDVNDCLIGRKKA